MGTLALNASSALRSLIYGFIGANTLTLKSDLRARGRRKNLEFTVARQAESSVFMGAFQARLIRRL